VRAFYPRQAILELRREAFAAGLASEPGWHPLREGCPDYHRLHDNYPAAYVKQKLHAFYYPGWYPHNRGKFDFFREIYALKNFLAGHGFAKHSAIYHTLYDQQGTFPAWGECLFLRHAVRPAA
jgi:hypothetical protein